MSPHADESSSKSPNHAYPSAYGAKPWHDGEYVGRSAVNSTDPIEETR